MKQLGEIIFERFQAINEIKVERHQSRQDEQRSLAQHRKKEKLRCQKENDLLDMLYSFPKISNEDLILFEKISYETMKVMSPEFEFSTEQKGNYQQIAKLFIKFFSNLDMAKKMEEVIIITQTCIYENLPFILNLHRKIIDVTKNFFNQYCKSSQSQCDDKLFLKNENDRIFSDRLASKNQHFSSVNSSKIETTKNKCNDIKFVDRKHTRILFKNDPFSDPNQEKEIIDSIDNKIKKKNQLNDRINIYMEKLDQKYQEQVQNSQRKIGNFNYQKYIKEVIEDVEFESVKKSTYFLSQYFRSFYARNNQIQKITEEYIQAAQANELKKLIPQENKNNQKQQKISIQQKQNYKSSSGQFNDNIDKKADKLQPIDYKPSSTPKIFEKRPRTNYSLSDLSLNNTVNVEQNVANNNVICQPRTKHSKSIIHQKNIEFSNPQTSNIKEYCNLFTNKVQILQLNPPVDPNIQIQESKQTKQFQNVLQQSNQNECVFPKKQTKRQQLEVLLKNPHMKRPQNMSIMNNINPKVLSKFYIQNCAKTNDNLVNISNMNKFNSFSNKPRSQEVSCNSLGIAQSNFVENELQLLSRTNGGRNALQIGYGNCNVQKIKQKRMEGKENINNLEEGTRKPGNRCFLPVLKGEDEI